jgi:hypothetical protein
LEDCARRIAVAKPPGGGQAVPHRQKGERNEVEQIGHDRTSNGAGPTSASYYNGVG